MLFLFNLFSLYSIAGLESWTFFASWEFVYLEFSSRAVRSLLSFVSRVIMFKISL